jgi:outer membrane biosynthesis protein TonB
MSSTISSDQKKSIAISILLYGTLLMILFFIRFWPPSNLEELVGAGGGGGGVTVNFGDSDFGSGANYKSEVLNVKNQAKLTPTKATPEESILSQENSTEESVVIPQKEKPLKPTPVLKEEPKPVVVKPKVSNNTNDALSSIMKGSNKGGDGDDKTAGNKGKANGSLSSNGYYGTGGSGGGTGGGNGTGNGIGTGSGYGAGSGGGSGGGTGYSLGNRKAISKPKPNSDCSNETGVVVVEVTVDKNGNTINAVSGIRGTTITAKCLKDQAKMAAMNTKWSASNDASEKQVGKIVYNFGFIKN